VKGGPRWRTNCGSVGEELLVTLLTLMAVVAGVSGRTLSREISKSHEITLPDAISRRCQPVPHDALWLRLNIAPRRPSNTDIVLADQPQVDQPLDTGPLYRAAASTDQQPEVNIDFRFHDGGYRRRQRRDTQGDQQRRRQQRRQDRRRHSRKRSRRRDLLATLSDGQAWQCHMTSHWQRMPDDVFPPYVQTGSCTQSRCMMGLYECRARKYATRILRRLPGDCNPLPVAGDVTAGAGFEEAWVAEEYHVVVGCECSKRRSSGWYDGFPPSSVSRNF